MASSFFPPQGGGASSFTQLQGTIAASQIPNSIVVDSMVAAAAGIQETKLASLGASAALVTNSSGFIIVHPTTTSTEIGFVNGVTSAIQTQLNATEKSANKGAISGYAGLNASQQITNALAAITQLPVGTNGQALKTSAGAVTWGTFAGLLDTDTGEKQANKGIASGYAGLNASSQITAALAAITQLPAGANNQALKTNGAGTVVWGTYAGLLDTDTAEKQANKGGASGYAGLNASSQVTAALAAITQLPSGSNNQALKTNGAGTVVWGTFAGLLDTDTGEKQANKGAASGYADLNASSQITKNLANLNQLPALNNSIVVVTTGAGVLTSSSVTTTTLGFLDATSSIQTQLNGKLSDAFLSLGTASLGAAANNLSITVTAKKFMRIYIYAKHADGNALYPGLQFNSDTGTNYTGKQIIDNGAPTSGTGLASIPIDQSLSGSTIEHLFVIDILNVTAQNKKIQVTSTDNTAGDVGQMIKTIGQWLNTLAQITTINLMQFSGTGQYGIGTFISVFGHD